jgi:hypothetical protein
LGRGFDDRHPTEFATLKLRAASSTEDDKNRRQMVP